MIVRSLFLTFGAAAALVVALPAQAQSGITVYGGYRAGSGFRQAGSTDASIDMDSRAAVSVALDWPYDTARQLQLLVSHQRTELNNLGATPNRMPLRVSYVHLGGLNFFEGQVGRGPYVAGGVGITHLSPDLNGTSSRVRASLNAGLGYQWPISQSLAVRTELRGYVTLIKSSGSFFCSGGCVVQIKGDTLTQVEGMVGLTFAF
jgi:hypothetical protein